MSRFKNYDSIQDCVNDLVTMWYMDYKGYFGVNRAESREECDRLLVAEGYPTDPNYATKLTNIMNDQD